MQGWRINQLMGKFEVAAALPRSQKRALLVLMDSLLFLAATYAALGLRFNNLFPVEQILEYGWRAALLLIINLVVFVAMGLYRPILRYTGAEFMAIAAKPVLVSFGISIALAYFLKFLLLPRSVLINTALLSLLFVSVARFWLRALVQRFNLAGHDRNKLEQVIIYGAGSAGSQLAESLINGTSIKIVGFVDDNPALQDHIVRGVRVHAASQLPALIKQRPCDAILLAMPSVKGEDRRRILDKLRSLRIPVKTVPSMREILTGKVAIGEIRQIELDELLGRDPVTPDPKLLRTNITGKSVMVTGAGGSIGAELCRQIAMQQPKCLVLYEMSEFALYTINLELAEKYPDLPQHAYLGSVTDAARLKSVLTECQVDTIYHAAAYKHVPLVETNPQQGIFNNVMGTLTAVQCAIAAEVNLFVLISTDKAVRPTNIMGASKRIAELILQALATQSNHTTCLTMVRFGNVLGSSGSVVPRFHQQIAAGGPITVTHPEMTRYFMSIPEAARLVIQAGAMARGGEVFLLDMGEPVKIYDLATRMIQLSGLEPGRDIQIKISGLRPGEKLYEELLVDKNSAKSTQHAKIFCAYESRLAWRSLQPKLQTLLNYAQTDCPTPMVELVKELVPEYCPSNAPSNESNAKNLAHSNNSTSAKRSSGSNRSTPRSTQLNPASPVNSTSPAQPRVAAISKFQPAQPAALENRFYQRLAGMVVGAITAGSSSQHLGVPRHWLDDRFLNHKQQPQQHKHRKK
ncbi:polysaccharide biosynthesis protein CapD [Thalassoporum mexicanum PCC 7367]|uniref:polysaccharide biosynthesis protein n=1 Tax=Thalassoporum mexicanum TaxID=3457544 RepID=UPI00029FB0B0|nr:nucleoside-diphosphate sugar epimerase/dehydratase [Pseudanabaena sp. PCC 7367]AFY69424.1 polysaccharide biosynthesis protein CapD [Pseudanabaena sp. PCC 7367]